MCKLPCKLLNTPDNTESKRLKALKSYHILDTVEENDFDNLTALSAAIFMVPISTITFVDQERQWFKSHFGVANRENPIEVSFCAHAIQKPDEVLIIEDAKADARFTNNPLVTGDPNIAFYAGVPLVTSDGFALGTLCIIDRVPRTLAPEQVVALKILGSQVMDKLELRKNNYELSQLNEELAATNEKLRISEENLFNATNELENRVDARTEDLRERDRALTAINQRLEIALAAGKFGSYELDLSTGLMICTDQCKLNYGQPTDRAFNFPDLLEVILPEYREYLQGQVQDAIVNHTTCSAQYQIRWPDGSRHWMAVFGQPQYNEQGKAVKMFGVTFNISAQKEVEEKKDVFIGMVSHELKTPLTSLALFIQMAGKKLSKSDDTFLSGVMDKAFLQVKKMTNMINGFLNVSRLESGKIEIIKTQFDIVELLTELITEHAGLNPNQQINFATCDPVIIYADREKIGIVITNLISNAIKYSPKDSLIEIACKHKAGKVTIEVKDQGMGIKPEDQKRLFERYYRVDNDTHIAGFGIGLYLSSEIINYHDGAIGVESELGKGSTFYFTLPAVE